MDPRTSRRPEGTTWILAELSTRGHRLTWDVVVDLVVEPDIDPDTARVEDLPPNA
jgi:hypothetical protein